jgi:hypothetical protein
MTRSFIIALCIIATMSPGALAIPWTSGIIPICSVGETQDYPDIAPDGSGGAIIVWKDYRNTGLAQGTDLYAQRIDSIGNILWQSGGVPVCVASGHQWFVRIIPDGAGGALIVWDSQDVASNLYAQRLDASGNPLWAENGVLVCAELGAQRYPRIAAVSDGSGGAIIVWEDDRNGNMWDIYAQRIDLSGNLLWQQQGVAVCVEPAVQSCPEAVSDGAGGAIITWADDRAGWDIFAQRVDSAGTAQWADNGIPICSAGEQQYYPEITSDGAGGAIVVWEDWRDSAASAADIYAQRINHHGEMQWSPDGSLVCGAPGDQRFPYVVSDLDQGAIAVWRDSRAGVDSHMYAQRMDPSGIGLWANGGIAISALPVLNDFHQVEPDGHGGALMTWCGVDHRIYTQRLNYLGISSWGPGGLQLSIGASEQSAITRTTSGQVIVAWDQQGDIYARVVSEQAPVATHLQFYAVTLEQGTPVLRWTLSCLGGESHFMVYRTTEMDNAFEKLTDVSISIEGLTFSFRDKTARAGSAYLYRVDAVDALGQHSLFESEVIRVPAGYLSLEQNYPNPFNPSTVIRFSLPNDGPMSLVIYDARGVLVRLLASGQKPQGFYSIEWDGRDAKGSRVGSGLYFCRIVAGKEHLSRKIVLLK